MALFSKKSKLYTTAIIVAAGNSTRMGKGVSKQLLAIGGVPVLVRTLLAFEGADTVKDIIVVTKPDMIAEVLLFAEEYGITKLSAVIPGGATRALSVKNGFHAIDPATKYVAIHDGARCLITPDMIEQVCRAAYRYRAASAVATVSDTVKTATKSGFVASTVDRSTVFLATTPQVFLANLYRAALETVPNADQLTDDNQLIERLPHPIKIVDCGKENIKITTPDDVDLAEFILKKREAIQ